MLPFKRARALDLFFFSRYYMNRNLLSRISKKGLPMNQIKNRCLFLFLLLTSISSFCTEYDPLLVVVIMIKNEAPVIRETLRPFVDAGIKDYLIYDTGSTDDTVEITKKFFQDAGIEHAVIKQEDFIDFATSRNHALRAAKESFPNACFLLMPDAEWYIKNGKGLLQFCQEHKDDHDNAYLVRCTMGDSFNFHTQRLIRCRSNLQFVGAVHEGLNEVTIEKVSDDIFFEVGSTKYGKEKSQRRWSRDCELLFKEHQANPQSPRPVFYLAQTYHCLGDLFTAAQWYEKRSAMAGWDEENYITQYRLAQCYEELGKWDQALNSYLKAFSMRPHRAEPLVRLAKHYWASGERALCFLFARRAVELPYPKDDILFVEKNLYDYQRYDVMACVAWYVGEYELGEMAVRQALKAYPTLPHLLNNLNWYMQKKALQAAK